MPKFEPPATQPTPSFLTMSMMGQQEATRVAADPSARRYSVDGYSSFDEHRPWGVLHWKLNTGIWTDAELVGVNVYSPYRETSLIAKARRALLNENTGTKFPMPHGDRFTRATASTYDTNSDNYVDDDFNQTAQLIVAIKRIETLTMLGDFGQLANPAWCLLWNALQPLTIIGRYGTVWRSGTTSHDDLAQWEIVHPNSLASENRALLCIASDAAGQIVDAIARRSADRGQPAPMGYDAVIKLWRNTRWRDYRTPDGELSTWIDAASGEVAEIVKILAGYPGVQLESMPHFDPRAPADPQPAGDMVGPAQITPAPAPAEPEVDVAADRLVHQEVREAFTAFCFDPHAVLARPLLNDVSDELTAAFYAAQEAAEEAETALLGQPDDAGAVRAYRDAVHKLASAWDAADIHARECGVSHLSTGEQNDVRKARRTLDLALNLNTPAGERDAAYRAVLALLEGLVKVPAPALTRMVGQIDSIRRRQLTSDR